MNGLKVALSLSHPDPPGTGLPSVASDFRFPNSYFDWPRSSSAFAYSFGGRRGIPACPPGFEKPNTGGLAGREHLTSKQQLIYVLHLCFKKYSTLSFLCRNDQWRSTKIRRTHAGKTKSTKGWRPWELFFMEEFPTREEARAREKYLKSGYGKQWIKEKWSRSSGDRASDF